MLKQSSVYYRLRTSALHDLYWMIADNKNIQARQTEISFYQTTLKGFQKGCLIFDIGANEGDKAEVFLRLGAKVVAVEPDGRCQKILAGKFLNHRLIKKAVTLVDKAIGESRKTEAMWIDTPGSALNTFSNKWVQTLKGDPDRMGIPLGFARQQNVEMITLDDLIEEHGLPFFIKIDVEGYESNVLRGLKQRVPYVSFEVNLPEFRQEGLECIERLEQIARGGLFNYAGDFRNGLALTKWLPINDFAQVFNKYDGTTIEVFWRGEN